MKRVNIPQTTVRAIIKHFQTSETVANLPGRGSKYMLSPCTVRKGPHFKNCRLVASCLNNHKTPPPYQQAFERVTQIKPLLRATNKFKLLDHWNYDWNRVLWSDETKKLNLLAMYTVSMFGVKTGCIQGKPHTYHQIWWWINDALWMFCWHLSIVKINGIMNSTKYQDILTKNLVSSARNLTLGRRWAFQQDNDPKYTSKSTQKWFSENKINVLQWPSQYPDLNPIKNMWSELKRAIYKCKPKDMKDLEMFCMDEWSTTILWIIPAVPGSTVYKSLLVYLTTNWITSENAVCWSLTCFKPNKTLNWNYCLVAIWSLVLSFSQFPRTPADELSPLS